MEVKAFIRLDDKYISSISTDRLNSTSDNNIKDVWIPTDNLSTINALTPSSVIYATTFDECLDILNKKHKSFVTIKQYNTSKIVLNHIYNSDSIQKAKTKKLRNALEKTNNKVILRQKAVIYHDHTINSKDVMPFLKEFPGNKITFSTHGWTQKLASSLKIIDNSYSVDGIIIHRRSSWGPYTLEYKPKLANTRKKKHDKIKKAYIAQKNKEKISDNYDKILIRIHNRLVRILFPESCWKDMIAQKAWHTNNMGVIIKQAISVNRVARIKNDRMLSLMVSNKLILDKIAMPHNKEIRSEIRMINKYL